jgi:hypothetical protein
MSSSVRVPSQGLPELYQDEHAVVITTVPFILVKALVTTCWSIRAAASVGVAGAGPPHTVFPLNVCKS